MTSLWFRGLQAFVRDASGVFLDDEKRYLVEELLRPVMRKAHLSSLDELFRQISERRYSDLAVATVEALTINETSFFRDRSFFNDLSQRVLPLLMEARTSQRQLRIWCAGCSTGQEPYSLAMMMDDPACRLAGWRVEIVATDLSRSVIATAKRGLYSQFEIQRGLPVGMLVRYFRREGDSWQANEALRAKVTFAVRNLLRDFCDLGSFDLILCRNVLMYFDASTKRRVLANLTRTLAPDGYLALGGAERVSGVSDRLRPDGSYSYLFTQDTHWSATSPSHH